MMPIEAGLLAGMKIDAFSNVISNMPGNNLVINISLESVEKIPPYFITLFFIILAILILILIFIIIFLILLYNWLKRQSKANYPVMDKKVISKEMVLSDLKKGQRSKSSQIRKPAKAIQSEKKEREIKTVMKATPVKDKDVPSSNKETVKSLKISKAIPVDSADIASKKND